MRSRVPGGPAALAVGALVACGGAPPPPPPAPPPAPARRVVVEDSEPDDGLQVAGDKGHLDPAAVDAALAPHRAAMTRCYTQKVGRRSWLGGRVVLQWAIGSDGAIDSVRIIESDLGAWPVESCLLDIARQAVFARPIGGAAELTLPLELSVARPLAASDDPVVMKTVDGQLVKLDACAKGSAAAPDDVTVTLYLGARGRAESVGFAAPGPLDDGWLACAEKAALGWRLPESRRVTKVVMRYRPLE